MKGDTTSGVCFRVPFFIYKEENMTVINGKSCPEAVGMTATAYLESAGYNTARVAVEYNGEILPKSMYGETVITEKDIIEIVAFVGGG